MYAKLYQTELMNENRLMAYLEESFNSLAISHVKLKIIKYELKDSSQERKRASFLDKVHEGGLTIRREPNALYPFVHVTLFVTSKK